MSDEKKQRKDGESMGENRSFQPDPETLHTTDPQEHMKGPVSSPMHKTGDAFKTEETKEEADAERDRKL